MKPGWQVKGNGPWQIIKPDGTQAAAPNLSQEYIPLFLKATLDKIDELWEMLIVCCQDGVDAMLAVDDDYTRWLKSELEFRAKKKKEEK